jgi:hypothetical protein
VFRANVASRATGDFFWSTHEDPQVAIDAALGAAESCEIDGVDLGMGSTYVHPFSESAER